MDLVTANLERLKTFSSRRGQHVDDEDLGEAVDHHTMAGGGHAGRETEITLHKLRVSHAMRAFLVKQHVLSETQVGLEREDSSDLTEELRTILDRPHAVVPPELTDRSHPLPDYFISSSHNTYLMAHQLYGTSSAGAYETALKAGARCVEIDAWDGEDKDEPKVTHGYTLTSHIPFRLVCETIRNVVDQEAASAVNARGYRAAPILLSLENHCDAHGQLRLVQIMRDIFGDRLISKAVRDKGTREQQGTGEHVTLGELGSRIAVIVEYHSPDEAQSDDEDSASSEDEKQKQARREYKEQKRAASTTIIIPELAELGVYAQSVKPPNNLWYEVGELEDSPHHPLINVSETGLQALMPAHDEAIARHNSNHLMRVYPKGTRISSNNLEPVPFWGIGAQICALNWQTFGASMQINEALFTGTDGYVLKPRNLRLGGSMKPELSGPKRKLRLHVAGATDVPVPEGREADEIKPYLTCSLIHPSDLKNHPLKHKTKHYKQHKLGFLHRSHENPPNTDPIWDDVLEWDEFPDNDLVFLRLLIKSDDSFATNPKLAVNAVRLMYVQPGWKFIRMLDLKGRETQCCVLVKFEILDA